MDKNGSELIKQTLETAGIAATVVPALEGDETARYITVEPNLLRERPERLLNALAVAKLMAPSGKEERSMSSTNRPSLRPLGVTPESITFEDINFRS